MCELYVMQLYLQKEALERMGIHHFDAWATNFGEVTTALELTVEVSGFRFKSRFNKFTNLPELMTTFREVADVQTADMLNLPVPGLRTGNYIIVDSEPDWYIEQVMEQHLDEALDKVERLAKEPERMKDVEMTEHSMLGAVAEPEFQYGAEVFEEQYKELMSQIMKEPRKDAVTKRKER